MTVSGIAMDLAREAKGAEKMSRAARLHVLFELAGQQPPWWRPFARMRWRAFIRGIISTEQNP